MKNRVFFGLTALIVPALLFVAYMKAKPIAHRLAVYVKVPVRLQLVSGAAFPGLIAVTEDYVGGCNPDQGCDKPRTQRIYAVKADGTESEQFWDFDASGAKRLMQSIINGDATRAFLIPYAKGKTTYRVRSSSEQRAARMNPAKNCTENMQGNYPFANLVQPVGIEDVTATDAHQTFHTMKFHSSTPSGDTYFWYAPGLGCMELRSEYNWKSGQDGKQYLKTVHITRSVKLAAPPEELFTIPADYTEMKPSEAAHAKFLFTSQLAGKSDADIENAWQNMPDAKKAALTKDDERYMARRVP